MPRKYGNNYRIPVSIPVRKLASLKSIETDLIEKGMNYIIIEEKPGLYSIWREVLPTDSPAQIVRRVHRKEKWVYESKTDTQETQHEHSLMLLLLKPAYHCLE